ncbi:MAG: hypothetical protein ITG02_12230 [Patulibacter sp.]|nr:hypothetical protein [Patulibacter sp.]
MSRRTALACGAAVIAGAGAVGLNAAIPEPPMPSPPAPRAAQDLPDAPGTVRLAVDDRPEAPASVLTPAPGGRELLWTDRGTGTVRRGMLTRSGVDGGDVIAQLDVAPGSAGGVRGLAVTADGRVFASFVRARDRRLVVAEIAIPAPRIVWRGPRVGRRLTGGGLAALEGGRLALGVGDQGREVAASDTRSILGRVVTLDPDGPAGQTPRRRSRGWHDPTALAVGRAGHIWVADRASGDDAERLGRADRTRAGAVRSPFRRSPIALAVGDGGTVLLVCGRRSGRVDRTELRGVVAGSEPEVLRARCRYGIAVVEDRVYVSGDEGRIRDAGTVDGLRRAEPIEKDEQAAEADRAPEDEPDAP